jgi:hypothetical protein
LEEQLKESQLHLEGVVEERTKELQDALNVKSRFVATVSHGIPIIIIEIHITL